MKADHASVESLVKTARGQLDGVLRMIAENRYCVEILNQLLAASKILDKVRREILSAHLDCCVKEAFTQGNEKEKIDEIVDLLSKF